MLLERELTFLVYLAGLRSRELGRYANNCIFIITFHTHIHTYGCIYPYASDARRFSNAPLPCHLSMPCRMSHASIPAEVRKARAMPEDLIRLCVGIEDVDDLLEDLEQALASADFI